jgi:hypothetical protein
MSSVPSAVAGAVAPPLSRQERLVRIWAVRLPLLLDPWSRRMADAVSDGTWTARWRPVGAFAPPIAFLAGLLFPLFWPGMQEVYTESLVFLMLVIAGAILSGPVGVALLAGYILGDLADPQARYYGWGSLHAAGDMITYMLLGLPAVILPQLGRRMAEEVADRLSQESRGHLAVRAALYGVAMSLLTALWCQAMIVLVRPVFTFVRSSPETAAVVQVQTRWEWLALVAAIAAVARVWLESIVRRSSSVDAIRRLEEQRWAHAERRSMHWRRLPLAVRVALATIVTTVMLAGTYVTRWDALVVLAVIALVKAWRAGLLGSMPGWWVQTVSRAPVLVRFIVAPLLGYILARTILSLFWSSASLRPVMLGAVLTLIVFQVLFPPPRADLGRTLRVAPAGAAS